MTRLPGTFLQPCAESWPRSRANRSSASSCTRFSSCPRRRSLTTPNQCNTACSLISVNKKMLLKKSITELSRNFSGV